MLDILYEDNHIIIVNKKCGEIVQGDNTGDRTIADDVKEYLKIKYQKPGEVFLGVTHRIDRPTSGAVIFARTTKALSRINEMFREKRIEKTYICVVDKKPPKETDKLTHFIYRDEKINKSFAFDIQKYDAKPASLIYKLISASNRYFLLEIDLQSGRHHQIRAQLATFDCHIKGDLKYGAARSNADGGIHLHAYKLKFKHPVTKIDITIIAPPPDEKVWNIFKNDLTESSE
jgi:23S rRNA pseudouridine1911/1915/1917 synthase